MMGTTMIVLDVSQASFQPFDRRWRSAGIRRIALLTRSQTTVDDVD
jgi:hypothetical protein